MKDKTISMNNVITMNLENFLLRERDIDSMREEIGNAERKESEARDIENSLNPYNNMDMSMDEEKIKNLVLVIKNNTTEELRRRLLFFTFMMVLMTGTIYFVLGWACSDFTLESCFTYF